MLSNSDSGLGDRSYRIEGSSSLLSLSEGEQGLGRGGGFRMMIGRR
jgi:hypothetical protein